MKTMLQFLTAFLFVSSAVYAQNVQVNGYTRSDGTYVAPYTRTTPDAYKYNNYGRPSSNDIRQEQQYNQRDYDSDRTYNQFDYDDDNDGISDEYDN